MKWPSVSVPAIILLAGLSTIDARPLEAGAWPRGDGETFASLTYRSQITESTDQDYASLYFEYGLDAQLTVGLDVGRNPESGDSSALVFLRFPVFKKAESDRFAVEIGAGMAHTLSGGSSATGRLGLSWGRGITFGSRSGWIGADSALVFGTSAIDTVKLDLTLGASLQKSSLAFLQMQMAQPTDGDFSMLIAPTIVYAVTSALKFEAGIGYQPFTDATSLKIGLWTEF